MKTANDVDRFMKLIVQCDRLLADSRDLSKKQPDSPINKFKLRFVNEILAAANGFLPKADRPLPGFELFSEDDLPTCSDVVTVLSQYRGCLGKFWGQNIIDGGFNEVYWKLNGKHSGLKAPRPSQDILSTIGKE